MTWAKRLKRVFNIDNSGGLFGNESCNQPHVRINYIPWHKQQSFVGTLYEISILQCNGIRVYIFVITP